MRTMTIELTDKELKLIRANIAYAIENCTVEDKIMMENAQFSSKEMFQDLLKKLRIYDSKSAAAPQVSGQKN
jgi:5-bromo-4-chloroindolyl phosphate hydrolysis protein